MSQFEQFQSPINLTQIEKSYLNIHVCRVPSTYFT